MGTAFRRAQIGQESSRGTAVAADVVLTSGILTMDPDVEFSIPLEDRNSLAERHSRTRVRDEVLLQWNGPVTYQHIIHWLLMGIAGGSTGSRPDPSGDPSTYLWTFVPRLNTSNAQKAYTFEFGDEEQEFECEFVMASQLTFRFEMGGAVELTVNLFGRNLSKSSFTGGQTALTPVEAVASKTKVWIDGTWANLGTSLKQNLVRSIEITIPTGVARYRTAEGLEWYNTFIEAKRTATIRMSLVSGSDAETEYDAYRSDTLRAIRVQTLGPADMGGDNDFSYTLEFDMMVKWDENPELIRDDEGETVYNMVGHTYDDHTDNSSNAGTGQGVNGNTEGNDFAIEVITNVGTA